MSTQMQAVMEAISEQLNIPLENISPDASIQHDLKADSLEIAELILALEERFDLEPNDDAIEQIKTVNDIIQFVQAQAK